jgi:hypothetical protein
MGTSYDTDVLAWAMEQAWLLRAGQLSAIDALHIAEEIEDVGKSAQRELGSRMAVLLAHLLKWKYQPGRRGKSCQPTIRAQRTAVAHLLHRTPSLKHYFDDAEWLEVLWQDGVALAQADTELNFPRHWIWQLGQVLDEAFWPD